MVHQNPLHWMHACPLFHYSWKGTTDNTHHTQYNTIHISMDKLGFFPHRMCWIFSPLFYFACSKYRHTLIAVHWVSTAFFSIDFHFAFGFFSISVLVDFRNVWSRYAVLDRNIEMICNLIGTDVFVVNCLENSISVSSFHSA